MDYFGESTVPGALGRVVDFAVGNTHTCALDDVGDVTCWGNLTHVPEDLGTVEKLAAGNGFTCAVVDGGALTCWDDAGQNPFLMY
jgi:hypothetical protein